MNTLLYFTGLVFHLTSSRITLSILHTGSLHYCRRIDRIMQDLAIEFAGLSNICEVWHHAFMFVVLHMNLHIFISSLPSRLMSLIDYVIMGSNGFKLAFYTSIAHFVLCNGYFNYIFCCRAHVFLFAEETNTHVNRTSCDFCGWIGRCRICFTDGE